MTPWEFESHLEEARLKRMGDRTATPRVAALSGSWEYQGDLPLCAFYTEKHVLEAYLGQRLPADRLFDWYVESGTYDVRAEGVPYDRMGTALKVKGYPLQQLTLNETSLRSTVGKGYAVMVPVNPLFYWSPSDPMVDFQVDLQQRAGGSGVDHVVWVLDATPDAIYLQDTAVQNGGAAMAVRWEDVRKAWAPAQGRALVIPRVLPPLDADGDGVPLTDADHDGHASLHTGGDDCDDADVRVHPGATDAESNGTDEDCDGQDAVPTPEDLADAEVLKVRNEGEASAEVGCLMSPGPERVEALWDARDRLTGINAKFPKSSLAGSVVDAIGQIDRELAGGPCAAE